jgi:hypothetical protein
MFTLEICVLFISAAHIEVVHEDYARLERVKTIADYLTDHIREYLTGL